MVLNNKIFIAIFILIVNSLLFSDVMSTKKYKRNAKKNSRPKRFLIQPDYEFGVIWLI